MGFSIGNFFDDIVDAVTDAVDVVYNTIQDFVVDLAEFIVSWNEYEEVSSFVIRKSYLYKDTQEDELLQQTVLGAITRKDNVGSAILASNTLFSVRTSYSKLIHFLDEGNYAYGYPTMDSYVCMPNFDAVADALEQLTGEPCYVLTNRLGGVASVNWAKYYLQENADYDINTNKLIRNDIVISSGPEDPSTNVSVTFGTNSIHVDIKEKLLSRDGKDLHNISDVPRTVNVDISDTVGSSDSLTVNSLPPETHTATPTSTVVNITDTGHRKIDIYIQENLKAVDTATIKPSWEVDFDTLTYHTDTQTYTVQGFNGDTYYTLPYNIPKLPDGIQYTTLYHKASDPYTAYLFIYTVGDGIYPGLDNTQTSFDNDPVDYKVVPDIPLRSFATSYTNYSEPYKTSVRELTRILHIDADAILEHLLDSVDDPEDLDHVFISFSVPMLDDTPKTLKYMYSVCQNLYQTQAIDRDAFYASYANENKDPDYNSIKVYTDTYNKATQFGFIHHNFFPVAALEDRPDTPEYDIYHTNESGVVTEYYYYQQKEHRRHKAEYLLRDNNDLVGFAEAVEGPSFTLPPGYNHQDPYYNPIEDNIEYADYYAEVIDHITDCPYPIYVNGEGYVDHLMPGDIVQYGGTPSIISVIYRNDYTEDPLTDICYYLATPEGLHKYSMAHVAQLHLVTDADTHVANFVEITIDEPERLTFPIITVLASELDNDELNDLVWENTHIVISAATYDIIEREDLDFLSSLILVVTIIIIVVSLGNFVFAAATLPTVGGAAGTAGAGVTTSSGTAVAQGTEIGFVAATDTSSATAVVTSGAAAGETVTEGVVYSHGVFGIIIEHSVAGGVIVSSQVAVGLTILNVFTKFAMHYAVQCIAEAVGKNSSEAEIALSILGHFAVMGITTNIPQGISYSNPLDKLLGKEGVDLFKYSTETLSHVERVKLEKKEQKLAAAYEEFAQKYEEEVDQLQQAQAALGLTKDRPNIDYSLRVNTCPVDLDTYFGVYNNVYELNNIYLQKDNPDFIMEIYDKSLYNNS